MFRGTAGLAMRDQRSVARDEVHYRTRAERDGHARLPLLVVDISPAGLMARVDGAVVEGERVRVALPGVGMIEAHVRWSLGGRIGCEFPAAIELPRYYELLAMMRAMGG